MDSLGTMVDEALVEALGVISDDTSLVEAETSVVVGELEATEDWHTVSEPLR